MPWLQGAPAGRAVRIDVSDVGGAAAGTAPSGAPLGQLHGRAGRVVGPSLTYNDSVVIDVGGRVYDVHRTFLLEA